MSRQNAADTGNGTGGIDELRKEINALDGSLLELINRRLEVAIKIGTIKKAEGKPVTDFAREKAVIERLQEINPGPLPAQALKYIYREIIAASRRIQQPLKVSYLGPEATFTHLAAMNHFGRGTSFVAQASIKDVFEEVEKGRCPFGVVPVENSMEGAVNHTLDLFFGSDVGISAEVYNTISHDLLSLAEEVDRVKRVYSHPHALAQCRLWIRKNLPGVERVECASTSEAARRAAKDPDSAAVASSLAGQVYNLNVLAPQIQDASHNVTRFLVIGRDHPARSGMDKTSIMFATPHRPGALFTVLQPIADRGVNMVKLESRPSKSASWHYLFFVDLEGHIQDDPVREVFEEMRELCSFIKWLGSYPKAEEMWT
ncbi:MAG: prephenate dehydratase [Desulfatibacillaceae bacterium]